MPDSPAAVLPAYSAPSPTAPGAATAGYSAPTPPTPGAATAEHSPGSPTAPAAASPEYSAPTPPTPGSAMEGTPGSPPVNTVAPAITATVDEHGAITLEVDSGTWTGAATIAYTYQWTEDGTDIPDATDATYGLWVLALMAGGIDTGALIDCVVTATNDDGTASKASNSVLVAGLIISPP